MSVKRERQTARRVLKRALWRREIVKGPCSICGSEHGVQPHQPDPSKPLLVTWLCGPHLREERERSGWLSRSRASREKMRRSALAREERRRMSRLTEEL